MQAETGMATGSEQLRDHCVDGRTHRIDAEPKWQCCEYESSANAKHRVVGGNRRRPIHEAGMRNSANSKARLLLKTGEQPGFNKALTKAHRRLLQHSEGCLRHSVEGGDRLGVG
jgi:hypothetical protein